VTERATGPAVPAPTIPGPTIPGKDHVRALDGMRALAVLLVIGFHLRLPGFRAGFVGVDIFFVLSGFLITSLLLEEIRRTGRVSLSAFWARRARRLLPALVLVLLTVGIVTAVTATYTERASMRGDLLATTGYVANWHFIQTSTYFADIGVDSPLEHTWSLAIEEQFYLLWPLLVFGVAATVQRPRTGVGMVAVAGVCASAGLLALLWAPGDVERAYMGTDARIFEPLIGAAGAAFVASPGGRARLERAGRWVVAAGAATLLFGLVTIAPGGRGYFIGGAVLISLGTLAVIAPLWIGAGGAAARSALSWGPLVWIGVVSYGAYLWHWPVTLWLGVRDPGVEDLLLRQAAAAALTFGLAAISFTLVERPIRSGAWPAVRRPRSAAAAAPTRIEALRRRTVVTLVAVPCTLVAVAGVSLGLTRVPPIEEGVPVVMMIGDSVPARLGTAFERAFTEEGWRYVTAALGGCPPTGETPVRPDGTSWPGVVPGCRAEVAKRQDTLIGSADPEMIVWWDRFSVSGFRDEDGVIVQAGSDRFWSLRQEALAAAVDRLEAGGAIVVFIGAEPPGASIRGRCQEVGCDWPRFQIEHYRDVTIPWNEMLRTFAERHPEQSGFISITDVVCREDVAPCDDRIEGGTARRDGVHYEGAGEEAVIDALLEMLGPFMKRLEPPSAA
jgi:peptidoglycan/LPS O-acetylase OafA/YrhL